MSFQEKYLSILEIVQPEIEQIKEKMFDGIEVQEPLKSKLFDVLNAPSKHIRSVVSILYLKALGIEIDEKQILFQSAIELVHNASLIHDDVIDESSKRRSVKTINSEFGNKLAVIVGDYLLSVALKKIRKLNSPVIIDMFAQTLDDMCQGEVIQDFYKYKITTIEEYIKKTELKTAKLFETALCGGIELVAPHLEKLNSYPRHFGRGQGEGLKINASDFARNFGIAFQIRDDLINAKTTQNDIKDGIYTAPVIFAGSAENFSSGIEKTQVLLNNYVDSAQKQIDLLRECEYKSALTKLLGLIRDE